MQLNEFYNLTLETLGLSVDSDGFVIQPDGDEATRVLLGKKFLVMPTSEHVSTMTDEKVLFNPLQEDAIKGVNPSMVKLEAMQERKLSIAFNTVQYLLAKLAMDVKLQAKASLELNKFVSELNALRKPQMKEIVNENTLKLLTKVHNASYQKNSSAGSVAIKLEKSAVLDGEKFNKIANIVLPIYSEISANPKYVYDIEINRPADVGVLKLTTEFIVGRNDEGKIDLDSYRIGSNSSESPTFISVYKVYVKLSLRLNKLLTALSFIDKTICDAVKINHALKLDDLVHIETFKSSLRLIPKIDTNSSVNIPKITTSTSSMPATNFIAQPQAVGIRTEQAPVATRPMTAMERKLAEIRGVLPAATTHNTGFGSFGFAPQQQNTRQVVTVRTPGSRPPMTPEQLHRLNTAMGVAVAAPVITPVTSYGYATYEPAPVANQYKPFFREGASRF